MLFMACVRFVCLYLLQSVVYQLENLVLAVDGLLAELCRTRDELGAFLVDSKLVGNPILGRSLQSG